MSCDHTQIYYFIFPGEEDWSKDKSLDPIDDSSNGASNTSKFNMCKFINLVYRPTKSI